MIKKGCFYCGNFEKCSLISKSIKEEIEENMEGYREIFGIKCSRFCSKKEKVSFT